MNREIEHTLGLCPVSTGSVTHKCDVCGRLYSEGAAARCGEEGGCVEITSHAPMKRCGGHISELTYEEGEEFFPQSRMRRLRQFFSAGM